MDSTCCLFLVTSLRKLDAAHPVSRYKARRTLDGHPSASRRPRRLSALFPEPPATLVLPYCPPAWSPLYLAAVCSQDLAGTGVCLPSLASSARTQTMLPRLQIPLYPCRSPRPCLAPRRACAQPAVCDCHLSLVCQPVPAARKRVTATPVLPAALHTLTSSLPRRPGRTQTTHHGRIPQPSPHQPAAFNLARFNLPRRTRSWTQASDHEMR